MTGNGVLSLSVGGATPSFISITAFGNGTTVFRNQRQHFRSPAKYPHTSIHTEVIPTSRYVFKVKKVEPLPIPL